MKFDKSQNDATNGYDAKSSNISYPFARSILDESKDMEIEESSALFERDTTE